MYPKLCGYTYVVRLPFEFLDENRILIEMQIYIKCLSIVFYINKGKVILCPFTENERHHGEIHMTEIDSSNEIAVEVQHLCLMPFLTIELPSSDILILAIEVLFQSTFLDDEPIVYITLIYEPCLAVSKFLWLNC